MTPDSFMAGFLSTSGAGVFIYSVFRYFSNLEKNKAMALKTEAEAQAISFGTMSEGWQELFSSMKKISGEEKQFLQEMIDEERKECDLKLDAMRQEINSLKQKLNN